MPGNHQDSDYPPNSPSPMRVRYFLIVFLISMFFLGRVLYPFWSILVLSFLLSSFFRPIFLFFNRKLPATPASLLTCLIITAIVFVPLVFFISALSNEALTVYQWGRDSRVWLKLQLFIQESVIVAQVLEYLREVGFDLEPSQISDSLSYVVKMGGLMLYNQASAWAANIAQFLFLFLMMILVIFFLLIDLPRLIDYLIHLSPLPDDEDRLLIKKFEEIATAVLKGNGICGIIQGVLGGAVFSIMGLNSPILWGCIMAILAFLPILGIGLVMIPAALLLAINDTAGRGHLPVLFLPAAVFFGGISGEAETGGRPGADAHPAGLSVDNRRFERLRDSGDHLWAADRHRIYNPIRNLPEKIRLLRTALIAPQGLQHFKTRACSKPPGCQ